MQRKTPLIPGEYYHIFTRGVEKRKIFMNKDDYERFLASIYILNQDRSFNFKDFIGRNKRDLSDVYNQDREGALVSILSYSLMPNHVHFLIRENREGGISKFMSKILTAHSMYFNIKYERSGSLFVHPYRSEHVAEDEYFRHVFNYIHINCVELFEHKWKEDGLVDDVGAINFLNSYAYSDYPDFICDHSQRREARIVDWQAIPDFVPRTTLGAEDLETMRKKSESLVI